MRPLLRLSEQESLLTPRRSLELNSLNPKHIAAVFASGFKGVNLRRLQLHFVGTFAIDHLDAIATSCPAVQDLSLKSAEWKGEMVS